MPVEVGERFEGTEFGVTQASHQGASLALVLFDGDEGSDPGLAEQRVVLGEQAEQPSWWRRFRRASKSVDVVVIVVVSNELLIVIEGLGANVEFAHTRVVG